jgi:hypothetical protein
MATMTEVRNDAFQILGFHGLDDYRLKDKTNQEIFLSAKQAFRIKILDHHPDKGNPLDETASILLAYNFIKNNYRDKENESFPDAPCQQTRLFLLTVPENVIPEQQFRVVINNQEVMVTCPHGVQSGQRVTVQLP